MKDKHELNWGHVSLYRNELFGLSIISIMIFHFLEDIKTYTSGGILYNIADVYYMLFASIGVEVFLFLSGMGLFFSMKKNSDTKQFYIKRFKRLCFPYILIGGCYWIIRDFIILKLSVLDFLLDFSMLSFLLQGRKNIWFVAFIILMYLIYPIIFKCLNQKNKKKKIAYFLLMLFIWGLFMAATVVFFRNVYSNIEIAVWRIPIFIFGAYMGEKIYNKDKFSIFDYSLFAFGIIVRIAYFILVKMGLFSAGLRLISAVYAPAIIFITVFLLQYFPEKIKKALVYTGSVSLELYISHVTLRGLLVNLNMPVWVWYYYLLYIALAVLISISVYNLQKKISNIKKKT